MGEEIIVQTVNEVSSIDYAKETTEIINNQQEKVQNNMDMISEQLSSIQGTIMTANSTSADLSEVTSLIEDIDTTVVEAQNEDILQILNNQQTQINNIEDKLNIIINKLEM